MKTKHWLIYKNIISLLSCFLLTTASIAQQPSQAEIDKMMKQAQEMSKLYGNDTSRTKALKGLQDRQQQVTDAMKNQAGKNNGPTSGSLYPDPSEYGNVDNWRFPAKKTALLSSLPKKILTRTELVSFLNDTYSQLSKKLPAGISSSVQSIATKNKNDGNKMGDAAVKGAKAIDYVGAGTIEMLLNEDKSFYFMEMNTRIQVEHPVTEMLTGVDLVKEQIRVASGDKLSVKPPIERRGHVIECRVNAEDPARNFQPSPGRIDVFHPPGGPGVRLDTHVYAGYTVPPFYDSLLAKLICQGRDRQEALRRMQVALESFIIEGVTTTIPFLARVMANKHFQEGAVDTKFLERESELMKEPLSAA